MALEQWFEGIAEELDVGRRGVPFSADNVREYIRRFRVIAKDKRMSALAVCYAPGIPLPWSFYLIGNGIEYDTQALAVRFEAEQENEDDWPNWIVTVTYSTQMPEGGQPELPGDPRGPLSGGRPQRNKGAQTEPELEPPDIHWDEDTIRLALPYDLDGKIFLSSAGVPITPAPMFDFPYNTLVVTRNDVGYDPDKALEFAMAYNETTFMNAPPGCVQCMPFRAKLTFRGPISYHRTTYRLRFTPKVFIPEQPSGIFQASVTRRRITWKDIESTFLSAGVEELVPKIGGGGKKLRPITIGGKQVSQPVCLDENGLHIDPEDLKTGAKNPYFKEFRVREYKNFGRLFERGLQRAILGDWLTGPAAKYWNLEEPAVP